MLEKGIEEILNASIQNGWVMEPEAKRLLSLAGVAVPKFTWATGIEEAVQFSMEIGF
ncbi:MAG: acetyl-CoA synthetase, partial [Desulfobacterales bacterium]|nr:acetyl-CoA synthetase [Desulfobacterales bacterium]